MNASSDAGALAVSEGAVEQIKLRVLAVIAGAITWVGSTIGVFLMAMELPAGRGTPEVYLVIATLLLGPLLMAAVRRRSLAIRAAAVTGYMLILGGGTLIHYGLVIGDAPVFMVTLVVAVIYFGWRGLAAMLVAFSALFAVVAGGFVSGTVPLPFFDFGNPALNINATRSLLSDLVGLVIFGLLVTELIVGFERAIARMSASMEGERREREERERAQRAIAQAQKLEAIGRLAGGVAHDFNNALVVILGAAEMLRKELTRSDPRGADLAADIGHAARAASDITKQLLSFSRAETGQANDVPIDEVLEHLGKVLRRLLPRAISLEVDARSEQWAHVDRSQLEQVVTNLALNARDAMPSGGTLSLRAFHLVDDEASPRGRVIIEVEDTGTGIDEVVRASLFEPFVTTKGAGKGTGLGLYLAKGMVEAAGGELSCVSSPGQGSTFRVALPVTVGRISEPDAPQVRITAEDIRVLLVEDRDDVRVLMAEALREGGYQVVEAIDGTSAVAAIEGPEGFDILVTDAVMPGTRLHEVVGRFEEAYAGAPVLICSGYVFEELIRRGIHEGAYRSLPKPFTPEELLDAVGRALAERGS